MISYHRGSLGAPVGKTFTVGFSTADTNDPERIARGITQYAWAPGIFADGYRKRENFLFADWLGLDFESHDFSLAEALNAFSDMIHVIGTTRRHGQEKDGRILDRFRVLVKLEYRCEIRRNLEATLRRLARAYPLDKKCLDAARHFFPCREIVSVQADGYAQEVIIAREDPALARAARRARAQAAGVIPCETRHRLTAVVVPIGDRNNAFYGIAKDLLRAGFAPGDVLDLIQDSPTYGGTLPADIREELKAVIRSGIRGLKEEAEDDGRARHFQGQGLSKREGEEKAKNSGRERG